MTPTTVKVLRMIATPVLVLVMAAVGVTSTALPASAGSPGQNPAGCASPETWLHRDFDIQGRTYRVELRHSFHCGNVGWTRVTAIRGTGPTQQIIPFVWNPGQPSQDGVPGTNYTRTVDARPGRQVCGGMHVYFVDNQGRRQYVGWYFAGCYWG